MEDLLQDETEYKSPGECIRAARRNVAVVRDILTGPVSGKVEIAVDLLREVEVQLSCAATLLRESPASRDPELNLEIAELRRQTTFLRLLLAETERFLSGWVGRLLAGRTGYTMRGDSAPLFLVGKTSTKG